MLVETGHGCGKSVFSQPERASKDHSRPSLSIIHEHIIHLVQPVQACVRLSGVLKDETVIETPGDVDGVLDLCYVLVKDQTDSVGGSGDKDVKEIRRQGPYGMEKEDVAEEQGCLTRMIRLFRAESLGVQFEVRAGCRLWAPSRLTCVGNGLVGAHGASALRGWR